MMYHHTFFTCSEASMPKTKVAITLETTLLDEVDALVGRDQFPNRSQAIESAVLAQVARMKRNRLVEACNQLDPIEERSFAEEGLAFDAAAWPEY